MTLDLMLLGLRIISTILLLSVVSAVFVVLWLDFRSAAHYADNSRRVHGQLVALTQLDNLYAPTGDSYPLLPITTLGRASTNSIVIDDSFASSEHAILQLRDGQWWLEDRNSRNGTLLNDDAIEIPVIVADGDIIGIGKNNFRISLN